MPDAAREYQAARRGATVIARTDRAFVRMHGRDPVKMIQGLVTNDVAGAPEDHAVYAAMLSPKGKMLADLRVIRTPPDVLLETDAAALDNVTGTLRKFVPPLFAKFEVVDSMSELGVYGPASATVLGAALGQAPAETGGIDAITRFDVDGVELLAIRTFYTEDGGFDVIGPAEAVETLRQRLQAAGAEPISHETLEVLRIEAGTPRWGAELDENVFPLEAGIEKRAISTSKGCYTGQEVIIRIMHRGHVNWLLRGVLLDDAALPPRDASLLSPADGRKVGRITSACQSPAHEQNIALAYTRRDLTPPVVARLERIDGPEILITDLPFPSVELGEPTPVDVGS